MAFSMKTKTFLKKTKLSMKNEMEIEKMIKFYTKINFY